LHGSARVPLSRVLHAMFQAGRMTSLPPKAEGAGAGATVTGAA